MFITTNIQCLMAQILRGFRFSMGMIHFKLTRYFLENKLRVINLYRGHAYTQDHKLLIDFKTVNKESEQEQNKI
jgi:hypothetical protein